jgi:cobalt/nickel transport protein
MRYGKGWLLLLVLAVLSPLGAIVIGEAWGEWGIESIERAVGFRPEGMEQAVESVPRAPIPDYEIPGFEQRGLGGVGLVISALLGAGITAGSAFVIARMVRHGRIS